MTTLISWFLDTWQQAFGMSYLDSLWLTVALGVLAGVWTAALGVDPWSWLWTKKKLR